MSGFRIVARNVIKVKFLVVICDHFVLSKHVVKLSPTPFHSQFPTIIYRKLIWSEIWSVDKVTKNNHRQLGRRCKLTERAINHSLRGRKL